MPAARQDPAEPELHDLPGHLIRRLQQIAVAVSLFYFTGENTAGLPAQVVMHGQKKALLDCKSNKSLLAGAVHVEEF